jgi:hypothetical protein
MKFLTCIFICLISFNLNAQPTNTTVMLGEPENNKVSGDRGELKKNAPLKALIVDGQNNHEVWPKSTIMMKQYLEETGLFKVDIYRTRFTWKGEREKEYLPLAGVGETKRPGKSAT